MAGEKVGEGRGCVIRCVPEQQAVAESAAIGAAAEAQEHIGGGAGCEQRDLALGGQGCTCAVAYWRRGGGGRWDMRL